MRRFPYPKRNILIVIYGSEECQFCQDAKKLLDKKGHKYKYYEIEELIKNKLIKEKKDVLEKLKNRIGDYHYIPIIFIKGKFIGGYDELKKTIN